MRKKISKSIKSFYIIVAILLIIIFVNIIMIIIKLNNSQTDVERKWGVTLPLDIELIYKKDNIGWFGEGERYLIYKVKNNDNNFDIDYVDNSIIIKKHIDGLIQSMKIPENYLPKWENDYKGKVIGQYSNSHLCMVYFYTINELIICEEII